MANFKLVSWGTSCGINIQRLVYNKLAVKHQKNNIPKIFICVDGANIRFFESQWSCHFCLSVRRGASSMTVLARIFYASTFVCKLTNSRVLVDLSAHINVLCLLVKFSSESTKGRTSTCQSTICCRCKYLFILDKVMHTTGGDEIHCFKTPQPVVGVEMSACYYNNNV